ncbi:MAG: hypothetical protein AAGI34_07325 [Pseudomonadota bacterium]
MALHDKASRGVLLSWRFELGSEGHQMRFAEKLGELERLNVDCSKACLAYTLKICMSALTFIAVTLRRKSEIFSPITKLPHAMA